MGLTRLADPASRGRTGSQQQLFHDLCRVHPRESKVKSLETIAELVVIQAEQMKDGGVKVMHRDGITRDMPGEIIRLTMNLPTFDTAASHPQTEGARMMVATGDGFVSRPILAQRRAPEFTAPDYERGVKQAALFEVLQ